MLHEAGGEAQRPRGCRQGARSVQHIREEWAESEVRITSRQPSKQRDSEKSGRSEEQQVAGSSPEIQHPPSSQISAESSFQVVGGVIWQATGGATPRASLSDPRQKVGCKDRRETRPDSRRPGGWCGVHVRACT